MEVTAVSSILMSVADTAVRRGIVGQHRTTGIEETGRESHLHIHRADE